MSTSNGKPSVPGFVEIADDNGNVITGVQRIRLGSGLTLTLNESDPSAVIDSGTPSASGLLRFSDTVATLRLTPPGMASGSVFFTREYSSGLGEGGAFYRWDSSSTDADDGALTIKVTAIATGRFKYMDMGTGIFPLKSSAIDRTGATDINTPFLALLNNLMALGYAGVDGGGGTYKFTYGHFEMPTREEWVGFKFIGFHFDGTANLVGPFGPDLWCNVDSEEYVLSGGYGVHAWDGTVTADQRVFTGVEDREGLEVGATVLMQIGADPTNIGGAYDIYYAKITAVTPPTGVPVTVTVDRGVPRVPPTCDGILHSTPTWNENITRKSTRHDMNVVTGFQDNLEFIDCTFDHTYLLTSATRNCRIIRPKANKTYFMFRFDRNFDTFVDEPVIYNLTGGFPADPPNYSANYGFIFTNYGSYGTKVNNFTGRNIEASGGVWDEELTGDGVHFTGTTRAHFSNATDAGVHSGWFVGVRLKNEIRIDRLILTGTGNVDNPGRINIGHLEATGAPTMFTLDVTRVGSMYWNGEEWNTPKSCMMELRGVGASTSVEFDIPIHGKLRSLRAYASTLTGLTDIETIRDDSGAGSFLSYITAVGAAKWGEVDRFFTSLGFSQDSFGRILKIKLTTGASWPAGAYVLVDIEMLTASRSMDNLTYVDTSLPQKISGVGPPIASAQFVGQEYTDTVTGWVFTSKAKGGGRNDWSKSNMPVQGANMNDANQTITPGGTIGEVSMVDGLMSFNRIKTISDSGASAGDELVISSYETGGHTLTIVNGGPGAGTLYVIAGTAPKRVSIVFDGTNWGGVRATPIY